MKSTKKKSQFKSTIKEIFTWILLSLTTIIIGATFFFPLILASITGNWWFLFLFFISWYPVMFEVIVLGIIVQFKSL